MIRIRSAHKASAISAGLIELASTIAIFIPLNKCIEKFQSPFTKIKGLFMREITWL